MAFPPICQLPSPSHTLHLAHITLSFLDNPLPPPEPPLQPEGLPALPAPEAPWQPGRENPPWTFWDVVRIAVIAIVAIGVFSVIAMSIVLHGGNPQRAMEMARNPEIVVPAQFAAYVIVLAYMVGVVRTRGRAFWRGVRWGWPAMSWFAYLALGVALAILVQSSSVLLPIPKSLPIDRYFTSPLGAWLMAGFGVTAAPLVEELFFRGFLYPVLARRMGLIAGVIVTAALFALLHESQLAHAWAPLLLLFAVGLVLTAVRARQGSVAATFLIHVGYNFTLFFLLFLASDQFRHLDKVQ